MVPKNSYFYQIIDTVDADQLASSAEAHAHEKLFFEVTMYPRSISQFIYIKKPLGSDPTVL